MSLVCRDLEVEVNLGGPKGFQFSSISGFSLKNFCGLEFGGSKRVSIFFHFWIFLKELLWFGIGVQKDFNFLPFLDFLKRTFVVWDFHFFI